MKVNLSEIWDFVEVIGTEKINRIDLILGTHAILGVPVEVIQSIKSGEGFDTELLPDLFTNSEITWQPNEYASNKDCLAGLNILRHQCEEQTTRFRTMSNGTGNFYAEIIEKLDGETARTLDIITREEGKLSRVLGRFRKQIYPIIKFLIEHPSNHPQIKFEAVLRQDFMAKTLFNEYHVKFSDLVEPYWQVWTETPPQEIKQEKKSSTHGNTGEPKAAIARLEELEE